jgi:hypothetical protein
MADTVDVKVLYSGRRRHIVHLTNISDGTGESAVTKVDISTLTGVGFTPTYSAIDMIDYNIQGFASVRLHWDHTTDDEIAVLPAGSGTLDFNAVGGSVDPRTAGDTGDIKLTTNGGAAGATYDITIYMRPKS